MCPLCSRGRISWLTLSCCIGLSLSWGRTCTPYTEGCRGGSHDLLGGVKVQEKQTIKILYTWKVYQCCKGHHILYAIFNTGQKIRAHKIFTNEQVVKISTHTVSKMYALCYTAMSDSGEGWGSRYWGRVWLGRSLQPHQSSWSFHNPTSKLYSRGILP